MQQGHSDIVATLLIDIACTHARYTASRLFTVVLLESRIMHISRLYIIQLLPLNQVVHSNQVMFTLLQYECSYKKLWSLVQVQPVFVSGAGAPGPSVAQLVERS